MHLSSYINLTSVTPFLLLPILFLSFFVTETEGIEMDDDELLALISERKTISKTIDQYEGKKPNPLIKNSWTFNPLKLNSLKIVFLSRNT